MDTQLSALRCVQLPLVVLMLGFSNLLVDASDEEPRDAAALLQTATSFERSSIPRQFFEDLGAFPVPATQRATQASSMPTMALFDVGENAVPMSERLRHASKANSLQAASFLEESAAQPAIGHETSHQVFSSLPAGAQQPSTLLEPAFEIEDDIDKGKMGTDDATNQQLSVMATESPLAAEPASEPLSEEPAAVQPQQEAVKMLEASGDQDEQATATRPQRDVVTMLEASNDQVNRDFEDAEASGIAAKFVECLADGVDDCTHLDKDRTVPSPVAQNSRKTPSSQEEAPANSKHQHEQHMATEGMAVQSNPALGVPQAPSLEQLTGVANAANERIQEIAHQAAFEHRQHRQEELARKLAAITQKQHDMNSAFTVGAMRQFPMSFGGASAKRPGPTGNAIDSFENHATFGFADNSAQVRDPTRDTLENRVHATGRQGSQEIGQRQTSLLSSARAGTSEELSLEQITKRLVEDERLLLAAVGKEGARRLVGEAVGETGTARISRQ